MSDADADERSLPAPLRTVTERYVGRPNTEMDVIGWGMVVVMLVALLPLLPLVLLFWLGARALRFVDEQIRGRAPGT